MGVYADVWPVFFRRHGASLAEIGWLAGLSIAWSLKVLWSPLVDRFGERRHWIAACVAVMAGCLLVFAGASPTAWARWPGWRSDSSASRRPPRTSPSTPTRSAWSIAADEGPANSVRITAYRVGPDRGRRHAAAAALDRMARDVPGHGARDRCRSRRRCSPVRRSRCPKPRGASSFPALRRWLARSGVVSVSAFVLLYRVGDRAMGPMVKPFWVDRGFSDEEIAFAKTTLGTLATVAGAVVGGIWCRASGSAARSVILGALALGSNLGYAAAAATRRGADRRGLGLRARVLLRRARQRGLPLLPDADLREGARRGPVRAGDIALRVRGHAGGGCPPAGSPSGSATRPTSRSTAAFALPAFAFLPGARSWLGPAEAAPSARHSRQSAGTPARSASIVRSRRRRSLRASSSRWRRSSCFS